MPHAVITGPLSPERVHAELEPFQLRDRGFVFKVGESHLGRSGKKLLLEAVAVEGEPAATSRRLLLEIARRDDGVTVRIYPLTDTEKTEGVRRLVALVADRVRGLDPAAHVARSNLAPFLEGAT